MKLTWLIPTLLLLMIASPTASAEEAEAPEGDGQPETVPFGEPQPETQSVDELMASLQNPDATARIAAVRALGDRQETAAVEPLSRLLRADPVPEVRGWVVRALHDIDTPEAHAAVTTAAREDPDERVRSMAANLEGVSTPPPQPFSPAGTTTIPPPREQYSPPPTAYTPPQQQRVRIPGRGLRIAGVVTTASSYGLALLVGVALLSAGDEDEWGGTRNFVDWGWKLMLPVVGPAVAATTNDTGGEAVIFWLWSAIQVAGITMLSIGYARRARWLRENGTDEEEPQAEAPSFGIALLPGPGGLSLGGYF